MLQPGAEKPITLTPEQPREEVVCQTGSYPKHLAIIMDGNGRWAKKRKLPRAIGHRQGAETLRETMRHCRELGIRYLTVYAFSAENWERPEDEVRDLMGLLKLYLKQELPTLLENRIRLHIIGDISRLPEDIQQLIAEMEDKTSAFDNFHLGICLSYGARQEMLLAAKRLALDIADAKVAKENICEELLETYLHTKRFPDPDLLIRTGGEKRLSNFLLWQSAYTELYFTDVLWPDFGAEDLKKACDEYASRERRYGKR